VTHLNFGIINHISVTNDARVFKFCRQVVYIKCKTRGDYSLVAFFRVTLPIYAVVMCLFICPPYVTRHYCTKTAKRTITQTTLYDSPDTLVY